MPAPLLYRAYVAATVVLLPFAMRRERRKLRDAGIPTERVREKLGHATKARPYTGPLIWFHAASVGESMSVLSLITHMGEQLPNASFLITSGTATSAKLVASRLPPRSVHQFAPLDAPGPLKRFLEHWRPDAAIFVESELWPQMLRRTYAKGAKLALLNARLSAKSVEKWASRPALARYVFEVFDLILTQNEAMAEAMLTMHAPPERVSPGNNLKALSAPLPVDDMALGEAGTALADRPLWVASSTHEGEEQVVLAAHKLLLDRWPDLHLILAPRHPERGDTVARLIADANLSATRRSDGDLPAGAVYLADTLGELGTWYALSDIVFLGGSLLPIGGHNPFEVAHAGAAVISGPHVANFAETFAEMQEVGAVRQVSNGDDLADTVANLLQSEKALTDMKANSNQFAKAQNNVLDHIAARLIDALGLAT